MAFRHVWSIGKRELNLVNPDGERAYNAMIYKVMAKAKSKKAKANKANKA